MRPVLVQNDGSISLNIGAPTVNRWCILPIILVGAGQNQCQKLFQRQNDLANLAPGYTYFLITNHIRECSPQTFTD